MNYNTLTSLDNLFIACAEFRKGKKSKKDVLVFERFLEDNLFALHHQLETKTFRHSDYESFYVHDPKRRHIHKASVRDRVVHHLLYTYLYKIFDPQFIHDSYSCRLDKGTHKAVDRLEVFTRKVSKNYSGNCWVLHCDIKKFFASVDHTILKELLERKVFDPNILWLLEDVIDSFVVGDPSTSLGMTKRGIPLGNLTSQVFANIYLNELDQFIKHQLKIKYYIRYADDFVILHKHPDYLYHCINTIEQFITEKLNLELHEKKVSIRNLSWGIDFLGYIVLPHYRLPRTKTKRRVFNKLHEKIHELSFDQSLQSYLGYFQHAHTYNLKKYLMSQISLWQSKQRDQ